ncbi:hypothetical protein [Rheinheimera sp.]|uniref:hypothetical protein n=1 Tax=Rheinheimera sp. TaxID=1869214 RepID=UPI0025E4912B|nr:hypothetical protein [Rheinheimera sp.]
MQLAFVLVNHRSPGWLIQPDIAAGLHGEIVSIATGRRFGLILIKVNQRSTARLQMHLQLSAAETTPVSRTMKSRSYHDRYYVGSHIEDQILENGKGSVQDATCV